MTLADDGSHADVIPCVRDGKRYITTKRNETDVDNLTLLPKF